MIQLRVIKSGAQVTDLAFDDAVVGIGRDQNNLVVIEDASASRHHCQIERDEDGSWKIVDNASANGTLVNGQMVNFKALQVGDRISIGQTHIEVVGFQASRPSRRQAAVAPTGDRAPARTRRQSLRRASSAAETSMWLGGILLVVLAGIFFTIRHVRVILQRDNIQAARALAAEARFEEAMARLDQIPAGSPIYPEAQSLRSSLAAELAKFERNALETKARAEIANIENWTRLKGATVADLRRVVDRFMDRYGESSYVPRAREILAEFERSGAPSGIDPHSDQPDTPAPPPATLASVLADAESLVRRREYGAAIEILSDFWSEHPGADADKATARAAEIRKLADDDWAKVEKDVRALAAEGKVAEARELLDVADGFGVESVLEAVRRLRRELAGE